MQELEDQLRHVMDSFVKENSVSYRDLVGTLESIKFDLLCESREVNKGD